MTSVHLATHLVRQRSPVHDQALDLGRLTGMLLGNALQHGNLLENHMPITAWQLANAAGIDVSVQVLAGRDDALIGFGWAHKRILP